MSNRSALSLHIEKLRAAEASSQKANQAKEALLFWGTLEDNKFLPLLKGCVGSYTTFLRMEAVSTLTQVASYCHQKKIKKVISTSVPMLQKLLYWSERAAPKLSEYAGSHFTIPALDAAKGGEPIEVVFIPPLKQLATVPYGKFMARRLISKLTTPDKWYQPTVFKGFTTLGVQNSSHYLQFFSDAFLIAVDIETFKEGATIRCISYTGFFYTNDLDTDPSGIASCSLVLPMDEVENLPIMRAFNLLSPPKVFQNGKYDISYLTRYNCPVHNYLYDTANLFHSWYSELPKDLGFLAAFFIREARYWKDLSNTNDLYEYYKYNALDTWGTGNSFLAMVTEAPKWAINNYLQEFPLTFPCHLSEMTGIKRDMSKLAEACSTYNTVIAESGVSLNKMLSIPAGQSFNTNSPIQMKQLLGILGCKDLKNADDKALKKAKFRHPLNARILNLVTGIRKARKLVSTYLTAGKEFDERVLYALNPHGTDTSRLASREHHFWCGLQVQNIPRGPSVKCTLRADDGFYFAECDLEQAESRDTAYVSGDATLIDNVENSPDFHCANASRFFGIPFTELFDTSLGKVLNKAIRQIAKNVNHGASYNMGPFVLVETMGEENIGIARSLLNLPRFWSYIQVAEYLLDQFHKTFPGISGTMYPGIMNDIATSNMLVSKAIHYCTGEEEYRARYESERTWTRYCFGNPAASKQHLNSYIAHVPQSLNAQTLNRAYLAVFHDIALNPEHSKNFKLIAQIHDSILFQYRIGHDYLCDMVQERMEIPITILGYDGEIRTFTVPASVKKGIEGKPAIYWSETE